MSAKVNPRRVPRTEADVAAAYTKGVTEGLNRGIELMLYVLIDKHDAPMEDVQQLAAELNHAAACVPPKVYGAISTAVVVMDAVSKTIDAAQCVMADSLQTICVEAQDGR